MILGIFDFSPVGKEELVVVTVGSLIVCVGCMVWSCFGFDADIVDICVGICAVVLTCLCVCLIAVFCKLWTASGCSWCSWCLASWTFSSWLFSNCCCSTRLFCSKKRIKLSEFSSDIWLLWWALRLFELWGWMWTTSKEYRCFFGKKLIIFIFECAQLYVFGSCCW